MGVRERANRRFQPSKCLSRISYLQNKHVALQKQLEEELDLEERLKKRKGQKQSKKRDYSLPDPVASAETVALSMLEVNIAELEEQIEAVSKDLRSLRLSLLQSYKRALKRKSNVRLEFFFRRRPSIDLLKERNIYLDDSDVGRKQDEKKTCVEKLSNFVRNNFTTTNTSDYYAILDIASVKMKQLEKVQTNTRIIQRTELSIIQKIGEGAYSEVEGSLTKLIDISNTE